MFNKQLKIFMSGVLLSSFFMFSFSTFADSITKMIEVTLNSVNIQVNGKTIDGDNILYNGKTYVPLRVISEMLNKDVDWDSKTNTANIKDKSSGNIQSENNKPVKTVTLYSEDGRVIENVPENKIASYGSGWYTEKPKQKVTILKEGFFNQGTTTFYTVAFSDKFMVFMKIPKDKVKQYETAFIGIKTNEMENGSINKPNIVGFSELFKEEYYPLSFNDYKSVISQELQKDYKELDFYEKFNSFEMGQNPGGFVVYDSFVKLEGVSYDDGVHKCKLYFEDKKR